MDGQYDAGTCMNDRRQRSSTPPGHGAGTAEEGRAATRDLHSPLPPFPTTALRVTVLTAGPCNHYRYPLLTTCIPTLHRHGYYYTPRDCRAAAHRLHHSKQRRTRGEQVRTRGRHARYLHMPPCRHLQGFVIQCHSGGTFPGLPTVLALWMPDSSGWRLWDYSCTQQQCFQCSQDITRHARLPLRCAVCEATLPAHCSICFTSHQHPAASSTRISALLALTTPALPPPRHCISTALLPAPCRRTRR